MREVVATIVAHAIEKRTQAKVNNILLTVLTLVPNFIYLNHTNAYRETNIMFYVVDEGWDFCTTKKKAFCFSLFTYWFSYIPLRVA